MLRFCAFWFLCFFPSENDSLKCQNMGELFLFFEVLFTGWGMQFFFWFELIYI